MNSADVSTVSNLSVELFREAELACLLREKTVIRLQEIADISTNVNMKPKYVAAAVRELVNLEKNIREQSLMCVNKITKWSLSLPDASSSSSSGPRSFILIDNKDYLVKMYSDLNFLATQLNSSFVRYGKYEINDPFFITREIGLDSNTKRSCIAATLIVMDAVARKQRIKKEKDEEMRRNNRKHGVKNENHHHHHHHHHHHLALHEITLKRPSGRHGHSIDEHMDNLVNDKYPLVNDQTKRNGGNHRNNNNNNNNNDNNSGSSNGGRRHPSGPLPSLGPVDVNKQNQKPKQQQNQEIQAGKESKNEEKVQGISVSAEAPGADSESQSDSKTDDDSVSSASSTDTAKRSHNSQHSHNAKNWHDALEYNQQHHTEQLEQQKKSIMDRSPSLASPSLLSKLITVHNKNQSGILEEEVDKFDIESKHVLESTKNENLRYRIGDEIGCGAFASVHHLDRTDGKEYAVKCFLPPQEDDDEETIRYAERCTHRELALTKRMAKHSSFILVEDVIVKKKRTYMIMELMQSNLLECVVDRSSRGRPSPIEYAAVSVAKQLFSAINFMHENDVVHRDIKPENILVSISHPPGSSHPVWVVKVADLGCARVLPKDHAHTGNNGRRSSTAVSSVSTPSLLSPKYNVKSSNNNIQSFHHSSTTNSINEHPGRLLENDDDDESDESLSDSDSEPESELYMKDTANTDTTTNNNNDNQEKNSNTGEGRGVTVEGKSNVPNNNADRKVLSDLKTMKSIDGRSMNTSESVLMAVRRDGSDRMTQYIGSRWYRPPEAMGLSRHYGKSGDVWSSAATIHEFISGEPLFPGDNEQEVLNSILPYYRTVPKGVEQTWIKRGLVVDHNRCCKRSLHGMLDKVHISFRTLLDRMLTLSPHSREPMDDCYDTIMKFSEE